MTEKFENGKVIMFKGGINEVKKIHTIGLALCLLTACSSEQESVSPNNVEQNTDAEQNTSVQDENLHLTNTLTGSYNGIYIDKYEDDKKIGNQIALFGEDLEQFLKTLQETTLIEEPLSAERPFAKDYYHIVVQGDSDVTTIFVEEDNGEQLVSLAANDIIPAGVRKATNTNVLEYIETLEQ